MRECNFKIKATMEDAKQRYLKFMVCNDNFQWDSVRECFCIGEIYVSLKGEYVLFEDMNGEAFFGLKIKTWLDFAQNNELIYAYYDEELNAEFIRIEKGICVQEFRLYDNEIDTDHGQEDLKMAFSTWTDIASFLDENLH